MRHLAAFAILILLTACAETPSATDAALKRRHFRPTVSALVPENWEAVKDVFGRTTHFKSPQEGSDDTFHENIGMSIKLTLHGDNLDQAWKSYLVRAKRPGMDEIETGKPTIAGMPARYALFEQPDNGRSYAVWLAESTPTEHVAFVAVMATPERSRFMTVFRKIVAGVELHPDAPR